MPDTTDTTITPPAGHRLCYWHGYGRGASYVDCACAGGEIVDLDDCDEPGGPCGLTGDRCPNCGGNGYVKDNHKDAGRMALVRQRERDNLCDMIRDLTDDEEASSDVCDHIVKVFELIEKLENPDA